uniref:Uncharacterized protein n=1 Tax=Arundo donax TaxID=35708 RepID=A0A0A8Z4G2_ARUDO
MVGHQLPARPAADAGPAEGGVRKERQRPRRSRKRDGDTSTGRAPRAA